jgi:branched-chain amino acid transport system substrate-binding protein
MFKQKTCSSVGVLLALAVLLSACVTTGTPEPTQKPAEPAAPTEAPAAEAPATEAPAAEAPAEEPQVVRIGVPYMLTGSSAQIGIDCKSAIELAADIINNEYPDLDPLPLAATAGLPNLNGAKIELVFGDTKGAPDRAMSEAERLITDQQVVALMGGIFSSCSATVTEAGERYGVPTVVGCSTSPSLHTRGFKWFFRVGPHDELLGENQMQFLAYLRDEKGVDIKTVALLHEDTLFGTQSADMQEQFAPKYGFEVVERIQYPRESPDMSSEILKIKSADPDAFMPTSYAADAILMQRTMKELDFNPAVILAQDSGHTIPQFTETLGPDADYTMSRETYNPDLGDTVPLLAKVNALFKEYADKDLYGDSAREFMALIVLADAINRAESTDPEAIRQALMETDLTAEQIMLPWEGVAFDSETGQNTRARGIMVQAQNGKYLTVWPPDVATSEPWCPMPAWNER